VTATSSFRFKFPLSCCETPFPPPGAISLSTLPPLYAHRQTCECKYFLPHHPSIAVFLGLCQKFKTTPPCYFGTLFSRILLGARLPPSSIALSTFITSLSQHSPPFLKVDFRPFVVPTHPPDFSPPGLCDHLYALLTRFQTTLLFLAPDIYVPCLAKFDFLSDPLPSGDPSLPIKIPGPRILLPILGLPPLQYWF